MVASSFCVFDLDGTISDPAVGIARSLNYGPNRSVNTNAHRQRFAPAVGRRLR